MGAYPQIPKMQYAQSTCRKVDFSTPNITCTGMGVWGLTRRCTLQVCFSVPNLTINLVVYGLSLSNLAPIGWGNEYTGAQKSTFLGQPVAVKRASYFLDVSCICEISTTYGLVTHNTIQYSTKFVKRHVAVASEALANRTVKKHRRRTNVL